MPSPSRVLFLAMDAGDASLIQQWAAEGVLPNIRALLARSLIGETVSVEGFYEGSTWPSFYTGLNPARHGFHSLTQLKPGTYDLYLSYPDKVIKRQPFWHYLSEAGRRVAVLDIPLAGVSKGLRGVQTVEWASHDGVYGFTTWPAELRWEVLRAFGRHPVKPCCDLYGRSLHDFRSFRNHLIEGVKTKAELTVYYLMRGGWDFFAQVFSESHCVGHQCWHLHEKGHPGYDPAIAYQMGDPICDVYREIDRAVGKILAHVGEDTTVVFLASHRMSHMFGANFLLGEILEKLHYLKMCPPGNQVLRRPSRIKTIKDLLAAGWLKMPAGIRSTLEPSLLALCDLIVRKNEEGSIPLPAYIKEIDFQHSKCFPVPNGNAVSGIRINLTGREPKGSIRPGPELNELCAAITEDLLGIRNMNNGKALIKDIKLTSTLHDGECSDNLPDLLIEWDDENPLGSIAVGDREGSRLRLFSEKFGVLEGQNSYCRTGDHRAEGLFMASGPGIKTGRIGRTVSIMDFCPTFMQLFGLKMAPMDGKPIPEILTGIYGPTLLSNRLV
jgi:predicted AlkP superfamily phosphohydrolase/phosphomutase